MSIIQEVYASGGDLILNLVGIHSPNWNNSIWLVQDNIKHTFTTPDYGVVTATSCAMTVSLPKRDASGSQDLRFVFDGVRPEATRRVRQAMQAQEMVNLVFHRYLASDKTEPAEPPIHFIVNQFTSQRDTVQITATLFDLIDMRWPRNVYNSVTAPCLKYYQG